MKKIILMISGLLIAACVFSQGVVITKSDIIEQRNGKSYYVHTVQKGQTVYSISRAYNVTPDEIYFENPGSKNGINISQKLYIRTVNKQTELSNDIKETTFDFFYHVAASNESFSDIASIYIIPENYIRKANPGLNPPFREGEYIKVPVEDAFDILDGKVKPSEVAESNIPIYKPSVTPSTSQTRSINSRTDSPKQSNKTFSQENTTKNNSNTSQVKKQIESPKVVDIIDSEFVSFDPDIPVISDYRHVVIMGETIESIASKYDIPVQLLKAANPGLGNTVVKGDRLRVPDKSKIAEYQNSSLKKNEANPAVNNEQTIPITPVVVPNNKPVKASDVENIKHFVQKKETLYSIGRQYGLTVDELIEANPGLTTLIKVGQVIIVPKKKINQPYIVHIPDYPIKTSKLARLYQISSSQIFAFNPNLGKRISSGEEVKIPVGRYATIVPLLPVKEIEDKDTEQEEVIHENDTDNDCVFEKHPEKIFKVALMIPFELEEADSLNKEQFFISTQTFFAPFRFIQFYEGALLAADSMVKQGMQIELLVYDVDKSLTKTAKVLQEPELRYVDLIIGPFYSNSFNQVALFAGNFNIPIINPLTYRDEVAASYRTVIKVNPTVYSQQPLLETYISKFAEQSKIFLISQTSYLDADIVTNIKNGILNSIPDQVKISNSDLLRLSYDVAMRDTLYNDTTTPPPFLFEKMDIYPEMLLSSTFDSTAVINNLVKINYSVDSLYPYLESASPIRENLVILYGTQKSFILDVLNKLNETRDTFNVSLIGLPTWERISNLSNSKMNNLNLAYFSTSFIDYDDPDIHDFVQTFRTLYGVEPDNYAFTGFDITYYFLNALFYFDKDLSSCMENYPMKLTKGTYNFRQIGNGKNFINDYWHLLRINNMQLKKVPDYVLSSLQNQ